jgi:hypothetical protein
MHVPTKYPPKEYLRVTGVLDPREHKKEINRQLKDIRKVLAHPATVLGSSNPVTDRLLKSFEVWHTFDFPAVPDTNKHDCWVAHRS